MERRLGETVTGEVVTFDADKGWGTVRDDASDVAPATERFFHCTAIADGTRTIEAGTRVVYEVVAGHLGAWEAWGLRDA